MLADEELMRRTAAGDLNAFNEIVLRHQQTAWRLAFRFLGDQAEAQDIAQEAFIRIFEAAPRYRATASFTTYLYRVVLRLCMDAARRKRPAVRVNIEESACPAPDAAQGFEERLRGEAVRTAIRRLPRRQRSAIILKEYCELSYAEIAKILSTSTKSVERLLARARETLQKELVRFHG